MFFFLSPPKPETQTAEPAKTAPQKGKCCLFFFFSIKHTSNLELLVLNIPPAPAVLPSQHLLTVWGSSESPESKPARWLKRSWLKPRDSLISDTWPPHRAPIMMFTLKSVFCQQPNDSKVVQRSMQLFKSGKHFGIFSIKTSTSWHSFSFLMHRICLRRSLAADRVQLDARVNLSPLELSATSRLRVTHFTFLAPREFFFYFIFLHPATNLKALLAARLRHLSVSRLKVSSTGSLQQEKRQREERRKSLVFGRAERAPLEVPYLREPEATVDEPQSNMKPKECFGLWTISTSSPLKCRFWLGLLKHFSLTHVSR